MAIQTTQLTSTSVSTVYTSSGNSAITTVYFCNTSGATVQANVYAVASGGTPTAATQIYSQLTIAGYDTYIMEMERLLYVDGDTLQVKSSATNGLTVTVSYTGI
jgi:hypothetical protein